MNKVDFVTGAEFPVVSGVDPGDGLKYRLFSATLPYSYYVSVSQPGEFDRTDSYYVFAMASQDWDIADSFVVGRGGTNRAPATTR